MDLTPAQRDRIRRLLEEELQAALGRAVTPADLEEAVADRRRALEALTRRYVAHDVQDLGDEDESRGGIPEQR